MDESHGSFTDAKWRALSAAGNAAFRRGADREARASYLLAIEEAARIWTLAKSGDESACSIAPVLHTIACHNLAELERRAGNDATSRALLDRALERLVDAARDASLPLTLRARAVANLKHALAEIVEHSPHSSDEALARVVARAMDAWIAVRALAPLEGDRPVARSADRSLS
jgi:hypothetical protein